MLEPDHLRVCAGNQTIAIPGGRKIMGKGDWAVHAGTVGVSFHDPIPTAYRTLDDGIMDEVRTAILLGLDEDERPLEKVSKSG